VTLKVSPLADLETTLDGPGDTAPATVQSEPAETLTLDLETAVDDPPRTVTLVDPSRTVTLVDPPRTVTFVEFCALLV